MVHIWETYEKEADSIREGMHRRKDFLYPPILPVVYYEGRTEWKVPPDFRSRIREGKTFGKYIPDFEYYLVPLQDYSNEALMDRRDEISLAMIINKLQTAEDIERFRKLPGQEMEAILQDTPKHVVNTIADILKTFLLKMNVPVSETEKLTDKVREKKMGELFADMEKMDIQAERRNTANAKKEAAEAKKEAEEAKKEAAEAKKEAAEAKKEAAEAEKRADKSEEDNIRLSVELCQELGASKDSAVRKLMEKRNMSLETAQEKIMLYWRD